MGRLSIALVQLAYCKLRSFINGRIVDVNGSFPPNIPRVGSRKSAKNGECSKHCDGAARVQCHCVNNQTNSWARFKLSARNYFGGCRCEQSTCPLCDGWEVDEAT